MCVPLGEGMTRPIIIGLALAGLILAGSAADTVKRGELWAKDAQAAVAAAQSPDAKAGVAAFLKLHDDFPENSRVLRNLAWQEQKAGDSAAAEKYLRMYAAMGATLPEVSPIYKPLADAGVIEKLPELTKNAEPVTTGSLVFTLSDPNLIAEDIAYDPATKHFFVSSVHERKILECDASGKCSDAFVSTAEAPLDAILALRVDAAREILWASTVAMNVETNFRAEDKGKSAVLKFDLRTHKLLRRFAPDDTREHGIGDMTIARNGDVYASDGQSGDVYVIRHGGTKLETLVPSGEFVSPQTPTLNEDESLLYVPDYLEGIAAIHLNDGSIEWIKTSSPEALEGIDGLYWTKSGLLATQNGISPNRLVRFQLSSSNVISRFDVLDANWPGFGQPTHGTIVDGDFYFIVNSGWERVGDDGKIADGKPASIWKMKIESN
jgi:hypothetical protein